MDPYDSCLKILCSSPKNPFLHSLPGTREMRIRQNSEKRGTRRKLKPNLCMLRTVGASIFGVSVLRLPYR